MDEMSMTIMNIIINAGDCKNYMYSALRKVNECDYNGADEDIEKANQALSLAHDAQTGLLSQEANGEKIELSLLFVHAQDHLMTAITEKNLIEQIIELRKTINTIIK